MENTTRPPLFKWMRWIVAGSIVVAVILLFLFLWGQTYDINLPINTSIFGTYGDFIGGVIGTVVALYSVYLLIKTFDNQADINNDISKTNKSIIDANKKAEAAREREYYQTELQLFDGKFRTFWDAYKDAMGNYSIDKLSGRSAFEKIITKFLNYQFDNNNEYKRRNRSAVDEYLQLYAENHIVMSVHLRMLYLLVSLISDSSLEEEDKVEYAKLVRGQMSSMEMLMVRYNCLSEYGRKMRRYCNQYNLIKHLPVMSLLEFKPYKQVIERSYNDRDFSEKLLNSLNSMFIALRKSATDLLYERNTASCQYKTTHRYAIRMEVSEDKKTFTLSFMKKTVDRRGGGTRISPDERALDVFSNEELVAMFKDFLCELFLISNFNIYNSDSIIKQHGEAINDSNEFSFKLVVNNTAPLVLAFLQMSDRDNSEDSIELS